MKNLLRSAVFLLFFGITYTLSASVLDDARNDYKSVDFLRNNLFSIKGDYVLLAGYGRIINSPALAEVTARRKANHQIIKLKELEIDTEKFNPELKSLFRSNLFLQYRIFCNIKYTAKNMITVASYIHKNYFYFACAYKLSDIEFVPDHNLDLNRVYNILKQADNRRNEFIFYEIIPENELSALKNTVENNIAKQYGANFALMFMDKDVPAIPQKKYDIAKAASEKYNSKTPFKLLLLAANTLPYDSGICSLLAEKFTAMEMPRCAAVMKRCAANSGKLTVIPEEQPKADDAVKNTNAETVKAEADDAAKNANAETVKAEADDAVKNANAETVKAEADDAAKQEGIFDGVVNFFLGKSDSDKTAEPQDTKAAEAPTVPAEVNPGMAPAEVKAAPAEAKAAPAEVKAAPAEVKATPTEVKAAPAEVQTAPAEAKAAPAQAPAKAPKDKTPDINFVNLL